MAKYLNKSTERVDVSNEDGLHAFILSFSLAAFQARNLLRCVDVLPELCLITSPENC